MEKRIVLFLTLSIGVLVANYFVQAWLRPPVPVAAKKDAPKDKQAAKKAQKEADGKAAKGEKEASESAKANDQDAAQEKPAPDAVEATVEEEYFSLGSADPQGEYRMVATLTNRGAALERVEFNAPRYDALEDHRGYLGYLAPADDKLGALVRVVGAGTAAALAGIKEGDVITAIGGNPVVHADDVWTALEGTRPGDQVEVAIRRGDETRVLTATLDRVPAQVIRPEHNTQPLWAIKPGAHDPLSLLLTLDEVDERRIGDEEQELAGVRLLHTNWTGRKIDERTVEFERVVAKHKLKIVKRYRLAQADPELGESQPAYHLTLAVEAHNLDEKESRDVAYRLDGPNGLPTEGWWYLNRISTEWGAIGTRDAALRFEGNPATLISSLKIADDDVTPPARKETADSPLVYAGVDSQYFSAVLLPRRANEGDVWFSEIKHQLVGDVPDDPSRRKLTNVSMRLVSRKVHLEPGESFSHEYQLFVGPKQPELLAEYGDGALADLVYFGWAIWGVVAAFLTKVLHLFYSIVGNYGIAIIMLTVVVRLCMFPLSRKQALSAQKMQELQPEMKRINEKHKGNAEARAKALQELWRKHNYNPMGGCLLAFVQLPIFIGLYRALMIDVELRGAPLFSEAVRWCNNLGGPDMLFDWGDLWPQMLFGETGWLGPYFNVLPLFTIALFLVQQKMFMPPATDEQTAMQQKIMKYMMIFMGILFYKVASGLCLYFIASSLWGIGERKLLPKMIAKQAAPTTTAAGGRPPLVAAGTGNGAAKSAPQRKKHRGRR